MATQKPFVSVTRTYTISVTRYTISVTRTIKT